MKRSTRVLLLIALLVSLCFNLFFVGGYLRTRAILKKIGSPEGRVQLIARRLDLTPEQEETVTGLVVELREKQAGLKAGHREAIGRFWAEIVTDSPDFEMIREDLARTAESDREARALEVRYLWEILQALTPEQREQAVKIIRGKDIFAE